MQWGDLLTASGRQAADPQAMLVQVQDQVRREPANSKHRIFLFQLLAVLGQWQRALNQLAVLGEMDAATLAMVQTYRPALQCEALRAEVFAGQRLPLIFGDPQPWTALLLEALRLDAGGHHSHARTIRDQAFEAAAATPGSLDGQDFAWIADADARLGPMLEVILNGRYFWVPFQNIQALKLEAPTDLRDLVWLPAQLTWSNGGEAVGLIPVRYPGSQDSVDPAVQLASKTVWLEPADGLYIGQGQRMLATDTGEYSLLDVRLLRLTPPTTST